MLRSPLICLRTSLLKHYSIHSKVIRVIFSLSHTQIQVNHHETILPEKVTGY